MEHDVFLSYSTKNKSAAEAVCAALERKGIGVWMAPRDIPPGSSYAASIVEAIDSARILVLVFSAAANDSQDIEREVQRADSKRLKIVPFRIEDVEPKASLAYFLPSRQYLDAFRPPIETRYDELSEVVRRIAPAQLSTSPSGDVKPLPPPSSQRSQRFLPVLAGIIGLLVASALVAWPLLRSNPAPAPTQVPSPPIASNDEPKPNPDKSAPRPANPPDSGDFGILFGSQKEGPKDPNGPMNEIRKARQIPNSPDPVLYEKNGVWMSVVTFDSPDARKNNLREFQAKFPTAGVGPIQLSVMCPNQRVLAGKEGDIPAQIECVP